MATKYYCDSCDAHVKDAVQLFEIKCDELDAYLEVCRNCLNKVKKFLEDDLVKRHRPRTIHLVDNTTQ